MVRVNLFDPVRRSIYGTATPKGILEVCCFALVFCVAMGVMAYMAVRLVETVMR
jgi:hypothetical protein